MHKFCLVPAGWTPDDCARHTCADRSHIHLSRRQVHDLETDNLVEWIHQPVNRRDKGVVRIRRLLSPRGLSCRVGAVLAEAVIRGEHWARVMLAEIRGQPVSRMPGFNHEPAAGLAPAD